MSQNDVLQCAVARDTMMSWKNDYPVPPGTTNDPSLWNREKEKRKLLRWL
ncbi:MAG: hypothetical protein U5L96_18000 [Owenweeksia sp.]|nr:hypothetical protein [Owenweeksia sp.]